MDNVFAYLGKSGSYDSLRNIHHELDGLFKNTARKEYTTYIKPAPVKNDRFSRIFGTKRTPVMTVDCVQLANEALTEYRRHTMVGLALTGQPEKNPLLDAFTGLESFVRDLFLSWHDPAEHSYLRMLLEGSAHRRLSDGEVALLRDRLRKILDDPVSEFTHERTVRTEQIRLKLNASPDTLFGPGQEFTGTIVSFLDDYFSAAHIRKELDAISGMFEALIDSSWKTFPDFLQSLQALLDNYARTEQDTDAGMSKLAKLASAFHSNKYPVPDRKAVADYKESWFLSMLQEDFDHSVRPVLEEDLRFLMITGFEYTTSLYRLKIRNSNLTTGQADYIAAFDRENRNIKKLIEYSGKKFDSSGQETFINDFKLGAALHSSRRSSRIVLPHFIRRMYDTPVTDGKQPEREPLLHSLYDIGPVLGLIGVSTTRRNPYLAPLSYDAPAPEPASVLSFLDSFSCVPFRVDQAKDVLEKCRTEADKEKNRTRKEESLSFLSSVTPEKLTVLGQYMTERFTHACFLSRAYQFSSGAPHHRALRELENDLQDRYKNRLQNGLRGHYDYYLDPVIGRLMLLPLHRVRLHVLDYLENFLNGKTGIPMLDDQIQRMTPAAVFRYLEIITKGLIKLITLWTEETIPWHLLYLHYLAAGCAEAGTAVKFLSDDYFTGKEVKRNCFYCRDREGKTHIHPSVASEFDLRPLRGQEDDRAFDRYARQFYIVFLEQTYRTAYSDKSFSV